jgi:hypothetical protein
MEEARRFLRYVIPGFVYGVETALLLLIIFPDWMYSQLTSLAAKDSLGVALASLFASGALGYIFATAHHWCHWYAPFDKGVLDHSPMINRLLENGHIPNQYKRTVNRAEALEISLALWYQRIKPDGPIGGAADKKLTSLGDHTHGLGAVRVASFFALMTSLAFCLMIGRFSFQFETIIRFVIMLALGIGVTYLFHDAYRRVGKLAQGLYERILQETLAKERGGITTT